jgi:hypothetical protein
MRKIPFEIRSHIEVSHTIFTPTPGTTFGDSTTIRKATKWQFAPATSAGIRKSSGFVVKSFRDLVHRVAELAVANPRLYPLFRGQNVDYLNRMGASKLYPSIFRPPQGKSRLTQKTIDARFKYLRRAVQALRKNIEVVAWQTPLSIHTEFWWSLLQHYELAATPLIDVSQSLRMAATFALSHDAGWGTREDGVLLVLGLPNVPASLAPMVDEQMVTVRLQSVSPPEALRPHFQEGFMVGRWPRTNVKLAGDNAAYRMIGKYRLENAGGCFWGEGFEPMPRETVYPAVDPFGERLRDALSNIAAARPD